jgi:hypothetical protein
MSLPPNIRVNARVPFPSSVQGAAFISVSKANGLWTITPNFRTLQGGAPSANYLVAVQDKNTGQFASIPSTSFITTQAAALTVGGGGAIPAIPLPYAGKVALIFWNGSTFSNLGGDFSVSVTAITWLRADVVPSAGQTLVFASF